MSVISVAQVVEVTDALAVWYRALKGTDASGFGLGTTSSTAGGWKTASDLEATVAGYQDWDISSGLAPSIRTLKTNSSSPVAAAMLSRQMLGALNSVCGSVGINGVVDLDTFAYYYNITDTTKWQCLLDPDFRDLFVAWNTTPPSAQNVYFELLHDGTSDGLGKWNGSYTAGDSISSTSYAGGFGRANVTSLSSSGTITVSGTWRKTDGTTATGNGTATLTSAPSIVTLTPPFTGALLLSVSGMSGSGGLAGTVYAEAARPSGR